MRGFLGSLEVCLILKVGQKTYFVKYQLTAVIVRKRSQPERGLVQNPKGLGHKIATLLLSHSYIID